MLRFFTVANFFNEIILENKYRFYNECPLHMSPMKAQVKSQQSEQTSHSVSEGYDQEACMS